MNPIKILAMANLRKAIYILKYYILILPYKKVILAIKDFFHLETSLNSGI